MMLTGGARLAARGGRSWVPVRVLREVGRGLDLELGRNVSPGPFLFLFFFPSFLFLFSLIFQTLFKIAPNRSKPTLQSF
jgi:hypothetical protein